MRNTRAALRETKVQRVLSGSLRMPYAPADTG